MCDDNPCGLGRRGFLRLVAPSRRVPAGVRQVVLPDGLDVLPRSAWAGGLPDPSPLPVEASGDVRFLLVHHSVSPNTYAEGSVVDLLRDFHRFHTGPDKGWPDVAYNFFVDRFGRAWEGRAGSLDAPVIGDATGGNQGFSQLVCLIGDFRDEVPSPAAQDTLVRLLAHLARTYGVDPAPGARTSFVSRGSNLHRAGTEVTTATIAGHRDMSRTACPGDAAYALVTGDLPARVAAAGPTTSTTTSTTSTTTAPAPETTAETTATTSTTTSAADDAAPATSPATNLGDDWRPLATIGAAGTAVVAGIGALIARRRRLMNRGGRPR
ncbi:MAG: peptidoglycan recognition protein family protein [Acidimicrobiales bacterium]